MKIGIIGANWSLKVHGAAWKEFPGVEVAAVCTSRQETAKRAAAAHDVPKAYWSTAELAADPDIDIIDVGSRPAFRHEMVMQALNGGKHVYNALPFTVDLAQARAQVALLEEKGVVGTVDAQFRWVPAAQKMKRMIEEGFIGRPLGFNMQLMLPFVNSGDHYYSYASYPSADVQPYKWLARKDSGASAWRNYGTHMLLLLMQMIGRVQSVSGKVTTGIPRWDLPDDTSLDVETDDLGCAVLEMENGAIGTMQAGWCTPDADYLRFELWGDKGRLLYTDRSFGDGVSAQLYAGPADLVPTGERAGAMVEIDDAFFEIPGLPYTKQDAPAYIASMGWMFHNMLEAIAGRATPSPSFQEALHAQEVVEALFSASDSGRRVDIGTF